MGIWFMDLHQTEDSIVSRWAAAPWIIPIDDGEIEMERMGGAGKDNATPSTAKMNGRCTNDLLTATGFDC